MGTLVAGIKEIFATTKTTGSNVMLCGNDGTPDGHMTMANLASVLGVGINTSETDFNNLVNPGVYNIGNGSSMANHPTGSNDTCILLVYKSSGGLIQLLCGLYNNQLFKRTKYSNWREWESVSADIPSFYKNYSDLASLASALGVLKAYGNSDFTGDLNTIMGNYYLRVTPSATNNPTGDYAQLISIGGSIGGSRIGVFQICFQYMLRSDIYVRAYSDDMWNAWKKITLTSIS